MQTPSRPDAPRILATTSGSQAWHGIPFELVRSPPAGSHEAQPCTHYWLAVVRAGRCDTRLRTAGTARDIRFLTGSFAGYNAGQHWDALTFQGPVDAFVFKLHVEAPTQPDFLPQLPKIGNFPCAQDAAILSLAEAMLTEFRQGCPSGRLYAESLGVAMAARLGGLTRQAACARSTSQQPRLPHRLVQSVSAFIEENIARELSIASLCGSVGMGATNFCRCFRGSFGISVHQYVMQRRLARARLLLDSDACLAEVALECGFSSQSRFTDAFRKASGTTPARYRSALRTTSLL